MYKKEWFNDDAFWERYAPVMFDDARWGEVSSVADGITSLARLGQYGPDASGASPRLLDLCCGFGRIALEMARRGFSVTGVDITRSYLDTARDDAACEKLDMEFIRQDARTFRRPDFFDLAVNLYISFGYFEDPEDDRLVLKNVYDSLKPGAAFIVETLGKEIAVRDFTRSEWFERAGFAVLTEYAPVDSWAALRNRWILVNGESRFEKVFSQRLYAASELRRLFLDAGFSPVEVYGGWGEGPYDYQAERLIVAGRKPAPNADSLPPRT
jgi:SAM-dependent methyltransferase